VFEHSINNKEFELYIENGATSMDALKFATWNAALLMKKSE